MLLGNSPLRDFSPSKSLFNLVWPSQCLSDLPFGYYEAVPPHNTHKVLYAWNSTGSAFTGMPLRMAVTRQADFPKQYAFGYSRNAFDGNGQWQMLPGKKWPLVPPATSVI
jgi:hypothetical protein